MNVMYKRVMLGVLVSAGAVPGLMAADSVEHYTRKTARWCGTGGFRELLLLAAASGAKNHAFDLTKKVKDFTVINNEIVLDTIDNATGHAFVSTGGQLDFDPTSGAWGLVKGYVRSFAIANASKIPGIKKVANFVERNFSKEVSYAGAVALKGATRIFIDTMMDKAAGQCGYKSESMASTRITLFTFTLGNH